MTHSLTDEIICTQGWGTCVDFGVYYDEDSLRAATDWQLEQVMKWINEYVFEHYLHAIEDMSKELAQAMRPQEDNS